MKAGILRQTLEFLTRCGCKSHGLYSPFHLVSKQSLASLVRCVQPLDDELHPGRICLAGKGEFFPPTLAGTNA